MLKKSILITILSLLVWITHAQTLKWSAFIDTSTTLSSPRSVHLNNDSILDIIIGGGLDGTAQTNGVNAINGADGSILWNFPVEEEIFGSAQFLDITGDGIKDVFIGGRYAEFYAIDGNTGEQIWEFFPFSPTSAVDSGWFNFYNPQFIPDQNSDGTMDILVANGGNHAAPPWDTLRDPGMLLVLDAMTGQVLAKDTMPDGEETYCSPTLVDYNGELTIFYGSGGENDRGGLWRTTLNDLMNNNLENSVLLASDPNLGFIAPSSVADMNGDGILDLINQAYDGTLRCFDGNTNSLLWEVQNPGTESSSAPTIGNFTGDTTPDVFNVVYRGEAPTFSEFYQLLIDGSSGTIVWKDSIGTFQYGSSAAVDLDMNGRDEAIISVSHHNGVSFTHELLSIDFQNELIEPLHHQVAGVNLAVTPMIEDLDNNGLMDIVFGYRADSLNPMGANGFYLNCIEGSNTLPGVGIAWGGYQGSQKDGHYTYEGSDCGLLNVESTFQNISCNTYADGTVSISPTAGIAPFSFIWNTGEIEHSLDSMEVGTYSVRITDSSGCYTDRTFEATDPYVISFGAILAPQCPSENTGKATVNSSGCPCMFNSCVFDWESGDSTKIARALTSGWQTVTITQMDGCVVVDSVFIPSAAPLLDSIEIQEISCATGPNSYGSIQLHLSDSSSTQIAWSNDEMSSFIDSLSVGFYSVVLYDSVRECYHNDSITLNGPETIEIIPSLIDPSCYQGDNGAIETSVSGGTAPYAYLWSNGETTQDIQHLSAGIYNLEVTDSLGCTALFDDLELTEPTELITSISMTNASCFGNMDGHIGASTSGGTAPYAYLWSNGETTQDIQHLSAGIYNLEITDSLGCTIRFDDLELTEPEELIVSIIDAWDDATGNCEGGAVVGASGGAEPYAFSWNDQFQTAGDTLENVCAGMYTITVTDANGCIQENSVTISNTLGLSEINGNIRMYPNPTNGNFSIYSEHFELINKEIHVLDCLGKTVFSQMVSSPSPKIDLTGVEKGIYFVSIEGIQRIFEIVKH